MSTPERTTGTSDGPRPSGLVKAWTWAVALGGAALLAVAASELIGGDADAGVPWLVLAGGFLVVGPIFFDRLTRLSVGPDGFRFDLSLQIARLDARDTAVRIDRWGGGLAEAAATYASAHTLLAGDEMRAARIRVQDHFVATAAASALVQQYDAAEVRRGPPVVRVLVLGLMQGDPSLADAATIESAITESRTANEQYHGLRLAEQVGRRLPPEDRRRLRQAIEREPITDGHARTQLRATVLVRLAESGDPDRDASGEGHGGRPGDRGGGGEGDAPAGGRRRGGRGAAEAATSAETVAS
jgi:hypothetical protein